MASATRRVVRTPRTIRVVLPYCTCEPRGAYGFDPNLGVYVHTDPKCWKPSKAYYEAARSAGVLAPDIERNT